ncbi:MAG TPA: DUF502 domain-containing protein [Verrucomicrobiae bacterium]|nr:DUF502 domain-containing protein [Verrucomicrobiae bacterium]
MKKTFLARWRANFFTGLAVILPGVVSIGAILWIFGTVASFTDTLLFFLPRGLTHRDHGTGTMYWYWSLAAFVLTILLICGIGLAARNYFGKKMIEWADRVLLHVPFLNKIYGATKQVNDALVSGNKNSFKTVVLVEFPNPGTYAMGFLTSEDADIQMNPGEKLVCVYVPTTPNPTAGFLLLVPNEKITRLKISVADGLKYIVSLGSIAPPELSLVER